MFLTGPLDVIGTIISFLPGKPQKFINLKEKQINDISSSQSHRNSLVRFIWKESQVFSLTSFSSVLLLKVFIFIETVTNTSKTLGLLFQSAMVVIYISTCSKRVQHLCTPRKIKLLYLFGILVLSGVSVSIKYA